MLPRVAQFSCAVSRVMHVRRFLAFNYTKLNSKILFFHSTNSFHTLVQSFTSTNPPLSLGNTDIHFETPRRIRGIGRKKNNGLD